MATTQVTGKYGIWLFLGKLWHIIFGMEAVQLTVSSPIAHNISDVAVIRMGGVGYWRGRGDAD
ncbi:hypothetical protein EYZ11_012494 [Aspergillus tanneri]|uniref:Uncharacterized protein n=1 Tax=Aspergillus tanneri TaxID=1220188 RepID=A0A4S3J043_9EURO|nr:hypothetical protein EYZ11_012494 [Aspergillus tanneri]